MTEPVWEFWKPGNFVLDAFAGKVSTTKACVMLENNRTLLRCGKDGVPKAMAGPVQIHDCQLLTAIPDLKGGEQSMEAAPVYVNCMKTEAETIAKKIVAPRCLPSVQTCNEHMVSKFFELHPECSLFNHVQKLRYTNCS